MYRCQAFLQLLDLLSFNNSIYKLEALGERKSLPKRHRPYEKTTEALTEALKYILVQLKIGFIALRRDF